LLIAKRWRPPSRRVSAARRTSWGSVSGRAFSFLNLTLFGLASLTALAVAGLMLWVVYGTPVEPRKSGADTLALQFEIRKGEPLGRISPPKAGETPQRDSGLEPGRGRAGADVTAPSIGSSGVIGSSSADAAEQEQAAKERQTAAGADHPQPVLTQTQDNRPALRQQESSRPLTYPPPLAQCNVNICSATYASFPEEDCTYQPHGGAPRRFCEMSTRSADVPPQTLRAATGPGSNPKDTQVAEGPPDVEKSAMPFRCNVDLCAAAYASFHAADCTYKPHGGGSRRICER